MRTSLAIAMAMLPACAALAVAQDQRSDTTLARRGLPPDVSREAAALFNASTGLRLTGPIEIERGREVFGDVAVLNGPITIGGHIAGRVIAINSDVILRPSARIDGDLLVVGGDVEGRDVAQIGGEIRIYRDPLRYRQEGDQIVAERDSLWAEGDPWWRRWEHRRADRSWSRLQVASAGAYNRVEGLPINLGPQLNRTTGWGSARLDAYAIFRTGSSFSTHEDDVGHNVRGELRIGRFEGFSLGGRLFNIVEGVEPWQLSDLEVGLASFLAHRDYRDYYQRHGGSASASLFAWRGVSLTGGFSDERWLTRDTRNPFTLFRSEIDWRPNPAVDQGRMHIATGTFIIDTRNDDENPLSGWRISADWERGVGTLQRVDLTTVGSTTSWTAPTEVTYSRGFLDLRRYNRVSPGAQLNLRALIGGWLSGDPLPIERRLSVDGPGVMPGFGFRSDRSGADLGTCNVGATFPRFCRRNIAAICTSISIRIGNHRTTPGFARATRAHRGRGRVTFTEMARGWCLRTRAADGSSVRLTAG